MDLKNNSMTIINNTRVEDTIKRYKDNETQRSKIINALSENNPSAILKIESKDRIESRKRLLNITDDFALERQIVGNDLMPINYLDRGRKTANSICRIDVKDVQGKTLEYGTGFMVSPSLMMTNNHVL